MEIRCLTYNIKDDGRGRRPLILEVLQSAQPDIVVLQEVGSADTAEFFAQALDFNYYFAQGNTRRNLALLSRFPIVRQQSYHPWPIHATLLDATIAYKPGQELHICGVHLIAFAFAAFELWRWFEVRAILNYLAASDSAGHLLLGDFNTFMPHDPVAVAQWPHFLKLVLALQGGRLYRWALKPLLAAGYRDCFRTLHPDQAGFTLPAGAANSRLDYIFAQGYLKKRLKACTVLQEPAAAAHASDHYPVMAIFDV